jgi:vesicle-fusing ATPase
MADFLQALEEVKPAFGAVIESLESYRLHGMIDYGPRYQHLLSSCRTLVHQVRAVGGKSSRVTQGAACMAGAALTGWLLTAVIHCSCVLAAAA